MGFIEKLKSGLTRTRKAMETSLGGLFSGFSAVNEDFYDELEESLILADLGVDTAVKAVDLLRQRVKAQHLKDADDVRAALRDILAEMLDVGDTALHMGTKP